MTIYLRKQEKLNFLSRIVSYKNTIYKTKKQISNFLRPPKLDIFYLIWTLRSRRPNIEMNSVDEMALRITQRDNRSSFEELKICRQAFQRNYELQKTFSYITFTEMIHLQNQRTFCIPLNH